MAEERDPKLDAAYRALGAEAPPRALDDAILAASRRAVQGHPAPLVAPTGRRSWSVPLAAAAVIALAVGVTVHLQIEQPGIDGLPPAAEPARPEAAARVDRSASPAPDLVARSVRSREEEKMKSGSVPRTLARETDTKSAERLAAQRPKVETQVAEVIARQQAEERNQGAVHSKPAMAERGAREEAKPESGNQAASGDAQNRLMAPPPAQARAAAPPPAAQAAPAPAMSMAKRADATAKDAAETPERELERIAELRKQAKHEEADKALAEFRKRYPDYKIPAPILERVERR